MPCEVRPLGWWLDWPARACLSRRLVPRPVAGARLVHCPIFQTTAFRALRRNAITSLIPSGSNGLTAIRHSSICSSRAPSDLLGRLPWEDVDATAMPASGGAALAALAFFRLRFLLRRMPLAFWSPPFTELVS